MRKAFFALVLALLCVSGAKAQQARSSLTTSAIAASAGVLENGFGVQYHQLTWNVTGTVSTCQVQLDQSADNVTWSTQIIPTQLCTSNGASAISALAVTNFVRINVTTFSGTGSITVAYLGYTTSPSGGISANTPGIQVNNGKSIIYASNYGVKAGGYKFCDANVPGTTGIVTIGNDAQQVDPSLLTLGITTSWIAWVTTWNCSGFNPTYAILNAVGTVVSVDSATQLHISTGSASTCAAATGGTVNKCTLYLFPVDDTAGWQAAWSAATAAGICGELRMPAGLSLISTLPLASTGGCAANNVGNGSWSGISIGGEGINTSVIVVNPTTNVSGCGANTGCLFAMPATTSVQNDIHVAEFTIDGGGQSTPPGNTSEALLLGPDSTLNDVGIIAWGIGAGLVTTGSNNAPVLVTHYVAAGVGNGGGGYELNAGPSTQVFGCNLFWGLSGLALYQGNTSFGQTTSTGCEYGYGQLNMVVIPTGKVHISDGDYCNNQPANTEACFDVSGNLQLSGATISLPAATGNIGIRVRSGGSVFGVGFNNILMTPNAGIGLQIDSGGAFSDFGITSTGGSVTPIVNNGIFVPNTSETYPASVTKVIATGTGACATITTSTGTIYAGSFKCTGTTGAATITLTPGYSSTNGFNCGGAADVTTIADTLTQSAFTVSTCVLNSALITSNDVITFKLSPF